MEVQRLSRENGTKDVDAHETRNSPKNSLTLQHSFPVELDYFCKQPPDTEHVQLQMRLESNKTLNQIEFSPTYWNCNICEEN